MLRLYNFDRSPFGWKTRLVLEEKKIPYTTIAPPDNKNEDPAFAKLNPYRLTPVLELEDGRTIYESTVIAEYLEEAYPQPPMLPKDPYERARVRMIEDTTDQYLYATMRDFRNAQFEYAPPYFIRKKPADVDHAMVEASRTKIREHLGRLEAEMEGRTWFGGEIFSLADAALVPPLTASFPLFGILPHASYPRIAAWSKRVVERPSYTASKPKEPMKIRD